MPANDFAPQNPAAVDEGKTYLIKGSTLKKLLAQDEFEPSQFDVRPKDLARKITLKPDANPFPDGVNLIVKVERYSVNGDGQLYGYSDYKFIIIQGGRIVEVRDDAPPGFVQADFTLTYAEYAP